MLIDSDFKPAWWLDNPHLQTLYPALLRNTPPHPAIKRERLDTSDGDFLDLDWCGEGDRALVILLHGLTGSSASGYIKGLQHVLLEQGFKTAALNFRGCSGQPNHLARCYHSGETEDIDFVYRTLRQREKNIPMAVAGFSLGGNVLLKWLGEQKDTVELFAAVAVSVPLMLGICATTLDRGFAKIYRRQLLFELKAYVRDKHSLLERMGRLEEAEKIRQLGDLSAISSFWQYDDCVVARLHDFKNVHDYYRRASSRQFIRHIRVPTLIIQAKDDPFMSTKVIPGADELSESVTLEISEGGGHVGFVGGGHPWKPHYWLEQRIPDFLQSQLTG